MEKSKIRYIYILLYILLIFKGLPAYSSAPATCPFICPGEAAGSHLASPVILTFNCTDGQPGDTICIPVTVQDFTSIIAIQLEVLWNHDVLEYIGVRNPGGTPGINIASDFNQSGPNALKFIPLGFPLNGVTLPDGAVLFEICFRVKGTPGSVSCIGISPYFTFEVVDVNTVVPSTFNECCMTVAPAVNLAGFLTSCPPSVPGGNGTIEVTAYGGTPPYTITWIENISMATGGPVSIPSEGDAIVLDVPAGDYTVTFTDVSGSTAVYSVRVGDIALGFTIIDKAPTCYKFSNGTIGIRPEGGIAPYGYIWESLTDPSRAGSGFVRNEGDTSRITSLPDGIYRIIVIDSAGCEVEATVVLPDNPFVITIDNLLNATCQGSANGVITLSISGATPDMSGSYTVRLPSGIVSTNSLSIGLLNPGQHSITISDQVSQCDTVFTFTIGYTDTISAAITVTDPPCAGTNNGRITLRGRTNSIPGPVYSYSIYQGVTLIDEELNLAGTYLYDQLGPGDYYAIVAQGSCLSDTIFFTVTEPEPITVSMGGIVPDNCLPSGSGDIWFDITNGTSPYILNAAAGFQDGDTLFNLNRGNYVLTVTDANGCTATLPFFMPTFEDNERADITFLIDGEPCNGGTVTVLYQGQPIPPNVGITWSNGTWTDSGLGPTIPLNEEDTLTVELFWGAPVFCILNDTVHILCPNTLRLDITVIQPLCGTGAEGGPYTGTVIADTVNAVAPVTWYWSFPDTTTTGIYTGLAPGWYYVTVTDALDSTAIDSFEIIAPPVPELMFTDLDSVSCPELCDGFARIFPFNGNTMLDYTIYWGEPVPNTETGTFFNIPDLCGGFMVFTVTQDGVCFYTDSVEIPVPTPVELQLVQSQQVTCHGGSDGLLEVSATGGTPGYAYAWLGGPASPQAGNLTAGTYTVSVTDDKGCVLSDSFSITQPDTLIASIDIAATTPLSCGGTNDGIITLAVSGGNPGGYTYQWNPAVSTLNQAFNVGGGMYAVTVTDPKGCTDTVSYVMTSPEPINVIWPNVARPDCFGDETVLTVEQVSGGSGNFLISINGGSSFEVGEPVILPAGIYVIHVADDRGCTADTTYIITEPNQIIVNITPPNPVVDLGDSLYIEGVVVQGEHPIALMSWISTEPVSCSSCDGTWVFNAVPAEYTWTVTDVNGCQGSTAITVNVDYDRDVYIPNVFTPNGDGRNEEFRIFTGQGVVSINYVRIYDRWGSLLHSEGPQLPSPTGARGWDGDSGGKEAQSGVYVYVTEITFVDNNTTLVYRGDVTLLR